MKCPMLTMYSSTYGRMEDYKDRDCLKEECAWWEAKLGKCSVRRVWIALQDIHEVLHDIAANLTLGGKR